MLLEWVARSFIAKGESIGALQHPSTPRLMAMPGSVNTQACVSVCHLKYYGACHHIAVLNFEINPDANPIPTLL